MKKSLKELLREVNDYDWGEVPDYRNDPPSFSTEYEKVAPIVFRKVLKELGIKLSGSILDLACGPVSLGCLHRNTVGFDIKPSYIKRLCQRGIKGIIGDIRDLPFEDNSFDYVIGIGIPWKFLLEQPNGVSEFIDRCIAIARKKVILLIISGILNDDFLLKHYRKIERLDNFLVCNVAKKS